MSVAYKLDFPDRHYDPRTGAWISEDPSGFKSGGTNLYQYAWNNPMKYVDPDGRSPQDVYLMIAKYNSLIQQMTNANVRTSPGEMNNLIATMNSLSFGYVGSPYLGCGEQANLVSQYLSGLKFEDKWTFVVRDEWLVDGQLHHRWLEAVSNNPEDPVLKIDPWKNEFTPKYR